MIVDFNYLLATGQVLGKRAGEEMYEVTGTCAAYVLPHLVLTAGHCVPNQFEEFAVALPAREGVWKAEQLIRHPEADVAAILIRKHPQDLPNCAFTGIEERVFDAGDFHTYGFPAEGEGAVRRYFKGHFQRFMSYTDPSGRSYSAGEMSIPAPAGLSGGPISWTQSLDKLAGIVTTNHDSYLVVDSFEEFERNGSVTRGQIRRVTTYGIAAMLLPLKEWLDELVESNR